MARATQRSSVSQARQNKTKQKIFKELIYLLNVKSIDHFEFMVHFEWRISLHKHKHIRQMPLNEISNSNFPIKTEIQEILSQCQYLKWLLREMKQYWIHTREYRVHFLWFFSSVHYQMLPPNQPIIVYGHNFSLHLLS